MTPVTLSATIGESACTSDHTLLGRFRGCLQCVVKPAWICHSTIQRASFFPATRLLRAQPATIQIMYQKQESWREITTNGYKFQHIQKMKIAAAATRRRKKTKKMLWGLPFIIPTSNPAAKNAMNCWRGWWILRTTLWKLKKTTENTSKTCNYNVGIQITST